MSDPSPGEEARPAIRRDAREQLAKLLGLDPHDPLAEAACDAVMDVMGWPKTGWHRFLTRLEDCQGEDGPREFQTAQEREGFRRTLLGLALLRLVSKTDDRVQGMSALVAAAALVQVSPATIWMRTLLDPDAPAGEALRVTLRDDLLDAVRGVDPDALPEAVAFVRGVARDVPFPCRISAAYRALDELRTRFEGGAEALSGIQGRRRQRKVRGGRIPMPSGTRWSDLRIRFLDAERVSITCSNQKQQVATFADLGCRNETNGKPDQQWTALRILARCHGEVPRRSRAATGKFKDYLKALRRRLKDCLGIEGDPVPFDRAADVWRTRFRIDE